MSVRISFLVIAIWSLMGNLTVMANEKIARIREGDVWVGAEQLTFTKGNISEITISPSGQFLSAIHVIGHYEQETNIENPTEYKTEPIFSVLILDIKKKEILSELKAPKALTHPIGWEDDNKYIYGEGSALDVYLQYQYDPVTNETKLLRD